MLLGEEQCLDGGRMLSMIVKIELPSQMSASARCRHRATRECNPYITDVTHFSPAETLS